MVIFKVGFLCFGLGNQCLIYPLENFDLKLEHEVVRQHHAAECSFELRVDIEV